VSKSLTEITGFPELQRKLVSLGKDKIKKREMHKILGQVANPTVNAARAQAPRNKTGKKHWISGGKRKKLLIDPGNLKLSIGKIKGKKGLGRENAVLYVGPRSKGRKNDGWYGLFVHEGTKHQDSNKFMKRAYSQTKGPMLADAKVKVTKYVQKQINRLSS
jgi:HK97 gp10 family phage protein